MLSDEEKEALEILKSFEPDDLVECVIYLQALEKITNLIEKQSKEIEELKEQCKEVVCVPEGTCFMLEAKDIDKKWEDKIKAKIEEVHYKMIGHQDLREAVKQALQSLLEKE